MEVVPLMNSGICFLKPHADNDKCESVVKAALEAAGCRIVSTRRILASEIDEKRLIDAHYGSLAEAAMSTVPASLP